MVTLVSSNVLLVSFPWRNLAFSSSPTHFNLRSNFSPNSQTRLFSSIDVAQEVEKDDSFTVSYLINSCGLSPESAKLSSKRLQLKDSSNPDSVLDCLRNYGFSDSHIKKIVRWHPRVLTMDIEKNLKPKIEFFLSIGVKGEDVVTIISRSPDLLGYKLNEKIIPCYDFLKRVLVHDELVVKSLRRNGWILNAKLEKNVVPNFELLKKVGVPESNFQIVLIYISRLLCFGNAKFSKRVYKVVDLGFDASSNSFLQAIRCLPTKSTWECKAQVCRSWGWSDFDVWFAFKKHPSFMETSVEKIKAVMDFLVNKMGWDPSAVAASSLVFNHSLEKSIIPKCSVIRVLMLKGLIREDFPLTSFIQCDRKTFLDRFVFKYLEQVSEMLDIYEGKVDLADLGFGFEEKLDSIQETLAS